MQALMRMRFGSYTFLQNPAQLQVENRAPQQEEQALSGGVCVTPAGRRATVITGKGWWYGGRALEMAQVLAAVAFARTGPLAVRPRSGAYAGVFDPV